MNLVFDYFDFTLGITGLLSFIITLIIICVFSLFISLFYSLFLETLFENLKPSISKSIASIFAFITSILLCAFYYTSEIDIDDYKALHTKLELYTENQDVKHALKVAIADKKVTKAEYSRLKYAFVEAEKNDARLIIEKYEREIKNKVLNP